MSTVLQSVGVFLCGMASGVGGAILWPLRPAPAVVEQGKSVAPTGPTDPTPLRPSEELTALMEAVEALSARVDALGQTGSSEAQNRVPVEAEVPKIEPVSQALADLSRKVSELSNLVASSIDRGTPFIPWKGGREVRFQPINPGDVSRLKPEELNELMRARSFEDIFTDFGQPSRIWTQGTRLQCEFTLPDGKIIGMIFVNGRVVDAYE